MYFLIEWFGGMPSFVLSVKDDEAAEGVLASFETIQEALDFASEQGVQLPQAVAYPED